MEKTIEVFSDVRCPFAHVGLRRLAELRDRRAPDTVLVLRAWPLELVNDEPMDAALIAAEVEALRAQVAPDLFRGFDGSMFPSTSLPALALTAGAYAVDRRVGERVALALRWALFEEGRDIAAPAVLLDIAHASGIEIPSGDEQGKVRDDWREGRDRGVVGSPHFFIGARNWFCPSLAIRHEGDRFDITTNDATLAEFVDRAFAA